MQDVTVTCGCSRKMGIDSLRGKGAYRYTACELALWEMVV
jgi:hypothetical protein